VHESFTPHELSRSTVVNRSRVYSLAVVSAIGVAVVYLPQTLQTLAAEEFAVTGQAAAWPQVAAQAGYAFGILLLLPLGDRIPTRVQVAVQLAATALLLAAASAAPVFAVLCVLLFLMAAATTVGPLLIADVLRLVPPERRGRTAATLGGSFLVGIFLSRTLFGSLAQWIGWRPTMLVVAALVVLCVPLTVKTAGRATPDSLASYSAVLKSIPRFAMRSPTLVYNTGIQICTFGAFIAMWATFSVHATARPLELTVAQASSVGITGILAGVLTMALGISFDRFGTRRMLAAALGVEALGLVAVVAWPETLWANVAGLAAVSLGAIVAQVASQSRALGSVQPALSARANTVYMVGAFTGGAICTALAFSALDGAGYGLVALFGLGLVAAAGVLVLVGRRRQYV
jgi:predicted MFS family arabinose efflux permease